MLFVKHNLAEDQNLRCELAGLRKENNTLKTENLPFKNENNDLIKRTNNLSYIGRLAGTKNAEEEKRDSMIIAMRLLIAESNTANGKSQSRNHNTETVRTTRAQWSR